ncbi:unnamed protein product [Pleuronectes platessa]|uniref:Uncharacterized protein n=1 Tax=Pleuronectes platessa TaxID=8262 RepID=A0A9N7Z8N3_PLEPL|nr:unnamed protein product [Pleuronectes platessa]
MPPYSAPVVSSKCPQAPTFKFDLSSDILLPGGHTAHALTSMLSSEGHETTSAILSNNCSYAALLLELAKLSGGEVRGSISPFASPLTYCASVKPLPRVTH